MNLNVKFVLLLKIKMKKHSFWFLKFDGLQAVK